MYRFIQSLFFLITLSLVHFGFADSKPKVQFPIQNHKPIVLFTQLAKSAVVTKFDETHSQLTLKNVHPEIVWFTDRPHREAGDVPNAEFIKNWNKGENSFAENPPNATVVYLYEDAKGVYEQGNRVVELTNPQYIPKDKTFTYFMKGIGNAKVMPMPKDAKLMNVALFIDSASFPNPKEFCKDIGLC